MSEWYYKATTAKISFEETQSLANEDGFLCRTAFNETGSKATNVWNVKLGDTIHYYYTAEGEPQVIGSFRIVGPNRHTNGSIFVKGVTGTSLYEVEESFAEKLLNLGGAKGEGYQPDPIRKKMTGWPVVRTPDVATPPFHHAPLGGKPVLVRG